jgi:prenyltransferase beta subunit
MRLFCVALLLLFGVAPHARAADAVSPEEKERRQKLDDSIKRALEYLHKSQQADGSWQGNQAHGVAVTSLCVMAFMSAGHVPGEGPYGDDVKKAIDWVLAHQNDNGSFAAAGTYEMYTQGIATLMLAEAVGMCDEKTGRTLRKRLEKAVIVILDAQRKDGVHKGGWRYSRVGADGDISVTGWQVMALRAAKNVGCDVPAEKIQDTMDYIMRCRDERGNSGAFCYMPNSRVTVACTGTSVLALQLCASKDQHEKLKPYFTKAADYILADQTRPKWGKTEFFMYGIYYCSQAMFQMGGSDKNARKDDPKRPWNYWEVFCPILEKELLAYQKPDGSWLGGDGRSAAIGADFCTSMAILSLTVEYRYLPIYQRAEDSSEK